MNFSNLQATSKIRPASHPSVRIAAAAAAGIARSWTVSSSPTIQMWTLLTDRSVLVTTKSPPRIAP